MVRWQFGPGRLPAGWMTCPGHGSSRLARGGATSQPGAPWRVRLSIVASSHLGGVGLDLMAAFPAQRRPQGNGLTGAGRESCTPTSLRTTDFYTYKPGRPSSTPYII